MASSVGSRHPLSVLQDEIKAFCLSVEIPHSDANVEKINTLIRQGALLIAKPSPEENENVDVPCEIKFRPRVSLDALVNQCAVRAEPIKTQSDQTFSPPLDFSFTERPFLIKCENGQYYANDGAHTFAISEAHQDKNWVFVNPTEFAICKKHRRELDFLYRKLDESITAISQYHFMGRSKL